MENIKKIINKDGNIIYPITKDEAVLSEDGSNLNDKLNNISSQLEQIENRFEVNVKDFGAIGDGITNDTQSIKKAIEYINTNGGNLNFENKIYNISVTANKESVFTVKTDKKVCINLNGAKLNVIPNTYPQWNVFLIENCLDVTIKNGHINGDRLLHDYTTISGTHEFGYGFFISNCGAIIKDMTISNMIGDGIIIKNGSTGGTVLVENCEIYKCRRQGISVLDSDINIFRNLNIHNIGASDGIDGTSPFSGIDLEPVSGTKLINSVIIENCIINSPSAIINGINNILKMDITNTNIIGNYNVASTNIVFKNSTIYTDRTNEQTKSFIIKCKEAHNLIVENKIINSNTHIMEGNYYNCNFIGFGGNINESNRIEIYPKATLYNCNLKDFLGSSITSTQGLMYRNTAEMSGYSGSSINYHNTCFTNMYIGFKIDKMSFRNIEFDKCNLFVENGSDIQFNNCSFNNCTTSNNYKSVVRLNNCDYLCASDDNFFTDASKIIINSNVIFNNKNITSNNFSYSASPQPSEFICSVLYLGDATSNAVFSNVKAINSYIKYTGAEREFSFLENINTVTTNL